MCGAIGVADCCGNARCSTKSDPGVLGGRYYLRGFTNYSSTSCFTNKIPVRWHTFTSCWFTNGTSSSCSPLTDTREAPFAGSQRVQPNREEDEERKAEVFKE